jgi:hypothetical protein
LGRLVAQSEAFHLDESPGGWQGHSQVAILPAVEPFGYSLLILTILHNLPEVSQI